MFFLFFVLTIFWEHNCATLNAAFIFKLVKYSIFSFLTWVKCCGLLFPALFTKISKRLILFKTSFFSANLVTSQTKDTLEPLVFFIILLTFNKSDFVLLNIITLAPASAKATELAFPIPFPAPVTSAILFLRSILFDRWRHEKQRCYLLKYQKQRCYLIKAQFEPLFCEAL